MYLFTGKCKVVNLVRHICTAPPNCRRDCFIPKFASLISMDNKLRTESSYSFLLQVSVVFATVFCSLKLNQLPNMSQSRLLFSSNDFYQEFIDSDDV